MFTDPVLLSGGKAHHKTPAPRSCRGKAAGGKDAEGLSRFSLQGFAFFIWGRTPLRLFMSVFKWPELEVAGEPIIEEGKEADSACHLNTASSEPNLCWDLMSCWAVTPEKSIKLPS